jgi:glucosamine--fructose-6-phosphate aminotransferase (isomerizing)
MGEGTAREGALKIKEITYVHAEGYSSSALKHGPFALLDKGFPVILFSPSDEHFAKNQNAFQEVYSRGASIIVIHDDLISNNDNENEKQEAENKNVFESAVLQIRVPKNSTFQSILNMIPIQMLAYKLAVRKGINPDKPKNLAKVVTVE